MQLPLQVAFFLLSTQTSQNDKGTARGTEREYRTATAEWQNGSSSSMPTCSCSCSCSVSVPVRTYLYIATAQLVQVDELFLVLDVFALLHSRRRLLFVLKVRENRPCIKSLVHPLCMTVSFRYTYLPSHRPGTLPIFTCLPSLTVESSQGLPLHLGPKLLPSFFDLGSGATSSRPPQPSPPYHERPQPPHPGERG